MRPHPILSLGVLAVALAGCQSVSQTRAHGQFASAEPPGLKADHTAAGIGPNSSAGSWQLPIQLTPTYTRNGEATVSAYVPRSGFVRGRPDVVQRIGQPLAAIPGVNHTVQTCRNTVASKAVEIGARDVEAVSAGPDSFDRRKGQYTGPVKVRVTYANPDQSYQVVESDLLCTVDRHGKIVNAVVAEASPS